MVRAADFSDPLFSLKQYEWNSSEAFLLDLYHEILNQVCTVNYYQFAAEV